MSRFSIQRSGLPRVLTYLLLAVSFHVYGAPTATEQKIDSLRRDIEKSPAYQTYNELARALVLRVRESGESVHYAEADRALAQSMLLAPDSLENESIAISILLGRREFGTALERARALHKRVPDDVAVYGHIVDAAAALGKYDEAEQAAQWMLDLRSTSILSLTRAATLREVYGDLEGALNLMQGIYPRLAPHDIEARAWHLTQVASLLAGARKTMAAEGAALAALALIPDYPHALGQLARIRLSQGRYAEAVTLELRRAQLVSHPENNFALARAFTAAGRQKDASLAFAEFEREALKRTHEADNANRELVYYYIDYARKPAQALTIATREIARRRDVHTLEAYAWALYANSKRAEARQELTKAMAGGICNVGILQRARTIAARPGERDFARMQQRCAGACCGEI